MGLIEVTHLLLTSAVIIYSIFGEVSWYLK